MNVQLNARATTVLGSGLKELTALGFAIDSVTRVLAAIEQISNSNPCANCRHEHDAITTGFVISGLNEAIRILAGEVCYHAERITNTLDDEGVDLTSHR